jgi:hypothetical protein
VDERMSERLSTEEREWLGTVLLPLLGDESSGPLEWHGCKPDCGPCACSGVPYLGPEVTAAIEAILAARLADQAARLTRAETMLAQRWDPGVVEALHQVQDHERTSG